MSKTCERSLLPASPDLPGHRHSLGLRVCESSGVEPLQAQQDASAACYVVGC